MKFINLTPHKIVYDDGVKRIEIEPSGEVLRLEYEERQFLELFDGKYDVLVYDDKWRRLTEKSYRDIFLKTVDASKEKVYVVSNPIAKHVKHPYVLAPDTSPDSALRDDQGNIIGVKRFCRYV